MEKFSPAAKEVDVSSWGCGGDSPAPSARMAQGSASSFSSSAELSDGGGA